MSSCWYCSLSLENSASRRVCSRRAMFSWLLRVLWSVCRSSLSFRSCWYVELSLHTGKHAHERSASVERDTLGHGATHVWCSSLSLWYCAAVSWWLLLSETIFSRSALSSLSSCSSSVFCLSSWLYLRTHTLQLETLHAETGDYCGVRTCARGRGAAAPDSYGRSSALRVFRSDPRTPPPASRAAQTASRGRAAADRRPCAVPPSLAWPRPSRSLCRTAASAAEHSGTWEQRSESSASSSPPAST